MTAVDEAVRWPFRVVRTRTGTKTHLVFHSPVIPWHEATVLPPHTVCARHVGCAAPDVAVWDVECLRCLGGMTWLQDCPAFGGEGS